MLKQYPTLYKRNVHGKVLIWYRERNNEKYRTVSGQQEGKLTTSAWTICSSKNVGKKNATTAIEQAIAEIEADYKKKLAQGGYSKTLEEIDTPSFVKPMLARVYLDDKQDNRPAPEDYKNKLVYGQPKLDGIRCLISAKGMFTRQGKPIFGAPHIFDSLKEFFEENPTVILDGELYNHALREDFNKIVSLVRKTKLTSEDLLESKENILYYIYDLASSDKTFSKRYKQLKKFSLTRMKVKYVMTVELCDEDMTNDFYNVFVRSGYEGLMVRLDNKPYENKRSSSLLKYKKFDDAEFTVTDILEGEGNNAGMAAKVEIILEDGTVVYPNMTGTWEYCREVLECKHEYIGGTATVAYFGYTPDGSLRFPRVKSLFRGQRDV